MELPRPHFHSFLVAKINGKLHYQSIGNYETRNESTIKLISLADQTYDFVDFDWVLINTDDRPSGNQYHGIRLLSFSTDNYDFSNVCPDFLFDEWPQVQINNYEKTIREMSKLGEIPAENNVIGWRGAPTHPNRNILTRFADKTKYDIEFIHWDRTNPDKLTCSNYVSLMDHVKKWRFLIDVEGVGWSARTKMFFFSKRVLFLQDRPYKEWFYKDLIPWKHYVPVKSDLSDLEENYDKIMSDTELEKYIIESSFEFAMNNLRRKHALQRWDELLNER